MQAAPQRRRGSPCCISISIASRSSTTASATWSATSCSSPCRGGSSRACAPGDALARLGGDEFAILLNGLSDDAQANAIAVAHPGGAERAVLDRRARSVHLGQHRHRLRPRRVHQSRRDHARRRHRDVSRQVARQGAARGVRRRHARARARSARASKATCATPSPATTSRCTTSRSCRWHAACASASSRWCAGHRNGEPVSPATFIPIAEELGLIEPLGTWVLQQACQTFADWQRRYPGRRPRLHHRQRVEPAAGAAELPARRRAGGATRPASKPRDLRLEITETALMDSPGEAAGGAARAARVRREGLPRRLRHRLFVAEPPAQAAGRRAEDRSLVRQQPAAARPSGDRREHPRAGAHAQHQRGGGRHRERARRASSSASAARTRRASSSQLRWRRAPSSACWR